MIPDFFPGIGRLDDLLVLAAVAFVLRRRFLRGSAAPRRGTGLLAVALVTLLITNCCALNFSPPAWFYNYCYRIGAPWDRGGLDSDITSLIKSQMKGPVTPASRAIDLDCGSGGYTVFMARQGFHATGVDFSPVALEKGRRAAQMAGVSGQTEFVFGDLTAVSLPGVRGPFDLLLDVSYLDDLSRPGGEPWRSLLSASPVQRLYLSLTNK